VRHPPAHPHARSPLLLLLDSLTHTLSRTLSPALADYWNYDTDEVLWVRPTAGSSAAAPAAPTTTTPVPTDRSTEQGSEPVVPEGRAIGEAQGEPTPTSNPAAAATTADAAVTPAADADAATPERPRSSSISERMRSFSAAAQEGSEGEANRGAPPPVASPKKANASSIDERRKFFAPAPLGTTTAPAHAVSQHKLALASYERKVERASGGDAGGATDSRPSSGGGAADAVSQHKLALASYERKVERASVTKGGGASQHAVALRSLQRAETAPEADWSGGARGGGGASSTGGGGAARGSVGVARLKQELLEGQGGSGRDGGRGGRGGGSQMEEAMRKLHGKGVVPTKQAYAIKAKQGSQHAEAMNKLKQMQGDGVDVTTGYLKRSSLSGTGSGPRTPPTRAGGGGEGTGGPSQRQLAMAALSAEKPS
jgi:hypothetical protein